jgi:hypothetical protein
MQRFERGAKTINEALKVHALANSCRAALGRYTR